MILALALAVAMQPAPVPDYSRFQGKLTMKDGLPQCRTTRSTGDAAADAIACAALKQCEPQYLSRLAGTQDRWIPAPTRKMMRASLAAERDECLVAERARLGAPRTTVAAQ